MAVAEAGAKGRFERVSALAGLERTAERRDQKHRLCPLRPFGGGRQRRISATAEIGNLRL